MFIRESSPDGKISYWTIRPEANRCLTLDQVYKVSKTSDFWHSVIYLFICTYFYLFLFFGELIPL